MSEYESRPIRSLHSIYTRSSLEEWFRLDVWRPKEAMCLICDIDPETADIDWPDKDSVEPGFEADGPIINEASLFSNPGTYLPTLGLTAEEEARAYKLGPISLEDVDWKTLSKKDKELAEIADNIFELGVAEETLKSLWIIFRRTKDAKEIDSSGTDPQWYVQWALKRGFKIPWLDWAIQHGFLAEESIEETRAVKDMPQRVTLSHARREEGLNAAIRILRLKHENDKLRNTDDFERYMRKAFVIRYIRENSEYFPHCAKMKSYPDKQSLKDREPTLTKDFPDFTKDNKIVEEYEQLILSK